MALKLIYWHMLDVIRLLVLPIVEGLLAISKVAVVERHVRLIHFMSHVVQFLFSLVLLFDCGFSFSLERHKLLCECILLLSHLILKLSKLIFEVRLQCLTDVLDDALLVNLWLLR